MSREAREAVSGERGGGPPGGVWRARRRRGRRVLAAHPDEAHVGRKVLEARVLALGDVLLHRAEVHRLLDQPRVVVQPHLLPVDGLGKVDRLRALQQRLEVGVALPAQRLVHRVEDEPRLRPLVAVPALRAGEGAGSVARCRREPSRRRPEGKIAGARSRRAGLGDYAGVAGRVRGAVRRFFAEDSDSSHAPDDLRFSPTPKRQRTSDDAEKRAKGRG